ncbi:hypothetical protein ACMXYR_02760 [Neptuniibacter sp. QD29_5]|uniref:hypothetical protein n=1 Tax=Neptuniibacter sp. QD29_5 TaxID=3398207 RepID=UPI0039F59621
MKNFILVEAPASRREPFLLIHLSPGIADTNREVEQFSRFTRWMSETKGYSYHTLKSYADRAALFLNFVFEASKTKHAIDINHDLSQILHSYQDYLLFGKDAGDDLAKTLADTLDRNSTISRETLSQNDENAVKWFLEVCASHPDKDYVDPIFSKLLSKAPEFRTKAEISAINRNSWLAGTIRNSLQASIPSRKTEKIFAYAARRAARNGNNPYKTIAYPIEKAGDLLTLEKRKRSSFKVL